MLKFIKEYNNQTFKYIKKKKFFVFSFKVNPYIGFGKYVLKKFSLLKRPRTSGSEIPKKS